MDTKTDTNTHSGTEKYTRTQPDRWTQTDMGTHIQSRTETWMTHTHMDIQTPTHKHGYRQVYTYISSRHIDTHMNTGTCYSYTYTWTQTSRWTHTVSQIHTHANCS